MIDLTFKIYSCFISMSTDFSYSPFIAYFNKLHARP